MRFLGKFIAFFALTWVQTALTLILVYGAWHYFTEHDLDFYKEEAFLFGIVFVPTVAALVIGLARAAGWKG